MGPGDPLSDRTHAEASTAGRQPAADPVGPGPAGARARAASASPTPSLATYIIAGALLGGSFGLVVVLRGLLAALVLALFATVGASIAGAAWAAVSGRVDLTGAIDALLRRGPR